MRFSDLRSRVRINPVKSENVAMRKRRRGLVALMMTAALVLSLLSLTSGWRLLDLRIYDYLSTIVLPGLPENGPIIVAIDEPSLSEIAQQWPWPRSLHAQLVEALRDAGASAIGLDIIFAEPSTPQADEQLAAAMGSDTVLAGDYTVLTTPQADQEIRVEPLAGLLAGGALTGIASIGLDGDGMMRRIPSYPDGFARRLADAVGHDTDPAQGERLLRVFGPARTYPTVSYYQALDPDSFLPADFFRGRPVIVGLSLQNTPTVGEGGAGADAYATSHTVRSNRLVPGAEIQATIYDNIVHKLGVRPASSPAVIAVIVLAALAAGLLVRRGTGWKTLATVTIAAIGLFGASIALIYLVSFYISPTGALSALVVVTGGQGLVDFAEERRTRLHIIRAFSQYLAPALVERLARDPSLLKLGGERRTISILFCDVRGFTSIAERMKDRPDELTALINRLLTPLSDIVLALGGTIDKYIGDCIMAFWNAPLDDQDHAFHAVSAALSMLDAIERLNAELAEEAADGEPPPVLRIGIGINTGDAIVGNMGSDRRFDYSALGDAVNLASRLESASKTYDVPLLIGETTAAMIGERLPLREVDRISVKGRSAISPVFTAENFIGAVQYMKTPGRIFPSSDG
ncbi:adenylate cyclase [Rhizobium albus]|nr:adenylate cyclase [Rhizobium albus]